MKMNIKNIKMKGLIASLFMGLAFLFSCEKQDVGNPLDGVGSSYLRLDVLSTINDVIGWNVGLTATAVEPSTVTAFVIHRDAISQGDLNKSVSVDFAIDQAYLDSYNPAAQNVYDTAYVNDSTRVYAQTYDANMHFINADGHQVLITADNYDSLHAANSTKYKQTTYAAYETAQVNTAISTAQSKGDAYATDIAPIQYIILPSSVYSFVADGLSGNTLTFAPGETTKELKIKIDPSTLSFANHYALPLTILNPVGIKISGDNPAGAIGQSAVHLINAVAVKNQWDGVYSYTGYIGRWTAGVNDTLAGGLGGPIADGVTVEVTTAGASSDTFSPLWAPGASGIGGIGTYVTIAIHTDNTVVLTPGPGGAPANWGPIAGKDNKYDPATQTFTINWRWGGTDPGSKSGYTREIYLTMKYKKPRA